MRFRCCIDLHSGTVKQIVGSTLRDDTEVVTNFESTNSSGHFARMYMADGLCGGHVIMLGPGNEEAAIEALEAYPGGLQVGGGITPDNALEYLQKGASHVIVTSYVFRNGGLDQERLDALVATVGKERLVLDLSCRMREAKYYVVTDRWQKFTDLEVNEDTLKHLATYCAEFLVHGVDVEGMQCGIMEDLVELLGRCTPIPVTYAGGASTLQDLERVRALGQGKVDLTIGSALDIFGGQLEYSKVVEWDQQQREM